MVGLGGHLQSTGTEGCFDSIMELELDKWSGKTPDSEEQKVRTAPRTSPSPSLTDALLAVTLFSLEGDLKRFFLPSDE